MLAVCLPRLPHLVPLGAGLGTALARIVPWHPDLGVVAGVVEHSAGRTGRVRESLKPCSLTNRALDRFALLASEPAGLPDDDARVAASIACRAGPDVVPGIREKLGPFLFPFRLLLAGAENPSPRQALALTGLAPVGFPGDF